MCVMNGPCCAGGARGEQQMFEARHLAPSRQMRLGFVNNGAATTTTSGFNIFPCRPDQPDCVSSPGSPAERSLPANVHCGRCSKRRGFSGYTQHYVLTVKQSTAHPCAPSQDQNMEVSGADFFSGLSVWALPLSHDSCLRLNVFGLFFFFFFVISR